MKFIKTFYKQIFEINDTPQRISLGLGLGVFIGILPGTGPLAALFLAFVFRVNRASAFLGSLATNTWLSLVTLVLSVKVGSAIMGLAWQDVHREWLSLLRNFHWHDLWNISISRMVLPVVIGYFIVSLTLGIMAYLITIILLKLFHHKHQLLSK